MMLAGLALKLLPVRRFLAAIPRPLWIALGVLALVGALWWLHADAVSDARKEGFKSGQQYEAERIAKKAREIQRKAEALSAKIKEKNREEADRINRDADALRLSGPGAARCSAPTKPARGYGAQPRLPDAPRPEVPSDERAAVPWGWLVGRAEQCDLNRAELLAWREWHKQLTDAWPK